MMTYHQQVRGYRGIETHYQRQNRGQVLPLRKCMPMWPHQEQSQGKISAAKFFITETEAIRQGMYHPEPPLITPATVYLDLDIPAPVFLDILHLEVEEGALTILCLDPLTIFTIPLTI